MAGSAAFELSAGEHKHDRSNSISPRLILSDLTARNSTNVATNVRALPVCPRCACSAAAPAPALHPGRCVRASTATFYCWSVLHLNDVDPAQSCRTSTLIKCQVRQLCASMDTRTCALRQHGHTHLCSASMETRTCALLGRQTERVHPPYVACLAQ